MKKEFYFEEKKDKEENISPKIGRRVFLKQVLGGLGIMAVSPYIKAMERISGQTKEREGIFKERAPEEIIDKLNYINEKIGGFIVKQLDCSWKDIYDLDNRPEAKKKLIKNLNQKPEIKESIKEPAIMDSLKEIGLEPEIVKEFLKTLPKSWQKEVALITYLNRPTEEVVNEFTREKNELMAQHQSKGQAELSEIYFFPGAKQRSPEHLLQFLIYEHAHVNNWRNRADLTLGQRISLLYEVIRRVESPDRFKYETIEKIKCKSKKEELTKKAIEYWAAISMHFLMLLEPTKDNPNARPPKTDMKLVFDYLKMTDPDFDILKMAKKRLEILQRVQIERETRAK